MHRDNGHSASQTSPRIVGLLLAAGSGTRYDPSGVRSKLLSPSRVGHHQGLPLAIAAWRNLHAVLDEVRVIVRPSGAPASNLLRELLIREGAQLIECADAARGIAASIGCGVRAAAGADGCLIALGDMPAVAPETIAAVAAALRDGHATAAPRHRGQRGHPVGFARGCFDALLKLDGDEGARAVLEQFPPVLVDVDDPGCLLDIDTREDVGEQK